MKQEWTMKRDGDVERFAIDKGDIWQSGLMDDLRAKSPGLRAKVVGLGLTELGTAWKELHDEMCAETLELVKNAHKLEYTATGEPVDMKVLLDFVGIKLSPKQVQSRLIVGKLSTGDLMGLHKALTDTQEIRMKEAGI